MLKTFSCEHLKTYHVFQRKNYIFYEFLISMLNLLQPWINMYLININIISMSYTELHTY